MEKECLRHVESDYEYHNLSRITNLANGRPDGYRMRLAFFMIGEHDAHITMTTTSNPNYDQEPAYEIGLYSRKIILVKHTYIFIY